MNLMLKLAIESLGLTPEAIERGWMDVEVSSLSGAVFVVRLTLPDSPEARSGLLADYAKSHNAQSLVRPMLDENFRQPTFLDSLSSPSLAKLSNAATGLILGPHRMLAMLEGELQTKPHQPGLN